MNASPTTRACPICRKPATTDHAPFCSTRCRDRDLVRWFSDGYTVPGPPASEDDILHADRGGRRE